MRTGPGGPPVVPGAGIAGWGAGGAAAPPYGAAARGTSDGSQWFGPPTVLVMMPVLAPAAVGEDPVRTGPPPPRGVDRTPPGQLTVSWKTWLADCWPLLTVAVTYKMPV